MAKVEKHTIGAPCWFDLMTSDAPRARAFYADLYGWTYRDGGPEAGGYAMCLLGDREAAGMGPLPPNAEFPPCWTIYFATEDADDSCERAKKAGGNVVMPTMDVLDAGRMAVCIDSTGAPFGLWQPRRHVGARVVNEPGAMAWCEVYTRDADAAAKFYTEVFGLEARKLDSPGMTYVTLHKDDAACAGVMQMNDGGKWANVPAHWAPYFAVANADRTAAQLGVAGGSMIEPPFDTPYGRMAVFADPQGIVSMFVQLPPES
jgi:predicted enzyme related to lactoylglutathione lyase